VFRFAASIFVVLCIGVAFLFSGGGKSSEKTGNANTVEGQPTSAPPASVPEGNKQYNF
jgi:hypothetical protein